MLTVKDLHAAYLRKEILHGLSLRVEDKEIVALVGANGSGKSTLLKTIAGLLRPAAGSIAFNDLDITGMSPNEINSLSVAYLMQGGEIFPNLTVRENLGVALGRFHKSEYEERMGIAYETFPGLEKVNSRRAGLLSGGEREMLAISMIMVQKPRLMLMDEPSAGLAPALVSTVIAGIKAQANRLGAAVLLVEQNVRRALAVCDRAYRLAGGVALEVEKERALDNLLLEREGISSNE